MTATLVAGNGFRRGICVDQIAALIARARQDLGATRAGLSAVATATDRAAGPAIRQAPRFGLLPGPVTFDRLAACFACAPAARSIQAPAA